jgi:hypothetical protein
VASLSFRVDEETVNAAANAALTRL